MLKEVIHRKKREAFNRGFALKKKYVEPNTKNLLSKFCEIKRCSDVAIEIAKME